MFERIIIPTDGSEKAKKAVEVGLKLAHETGDKVVALYVVDISFFTAFPPDSMSTVILSQLRTESYSAVNYVIREGKKNNVYVESKIVEGIPSEEILKFATPNDLIVIPYKKKTRLEKIFTESIAEKVIKNAVCNVLVVNV